MVNVFINLISGVLGSVANALVSFVLTMFAYMGKLGLVVLDMPVVTTGITYAQEVAGVWLSLKIAYEAYMIYILRQMGEPTSDPTNLLIGTVRSASVIAVMPWLVKYLYSFGIQASFEVAALPGSGVGTNINNSTFQNILNLLSAVNPERCILLAAAIIFGIVMLIIVVIQSFIKAAEIASHAWMGSFMALGLTNRDSQAWSTWWKDTLIITFSGALQMGMVRFSFYTLSPISLPNSDGSTFVAPTEINLLLFIAALWVTYKTPNTLKEKIYSSGIGRVGGAAVQSVGQSAIMRLIMKR